MRRSTLPLAFGLSLLAVACDHPAPTVVAPLFESSTAPTLALSGVHGDAHLSGAEEVPAIETRARGVATFRLSPDGQSLQYRLVVSHIDNVVASHVHLGEAGTNGPVTVVLFGPAPAGGGASNGVLAEGVLTASNLVGPLAGQPLSALVNTMAAGGAYVNVHTNDGVDPAGSGPGDFPGGEIRGQIR